MTWRMPAETDRHERTLMAWPTRERQHSLWHGQLDAPRRAWADVARAVAAFEPVTMVVDVGELDDGGAGSATALLGGVAGVELVELPIDDSWLRDAGPLVVRDVDDPTQRVAVHAGFNAWGHGYEPFDEDAEVASLLAAHLGLAVVRSPFVLEGGSIAVDGEGVLVTTQRCLLHPNRGPMPDGSPRTPAAVEAVLGELLGVDQVVWLVDALTDDDGTDGHVDNVVAFAAPGLAVLQGCDDPTDPDHAGAADNRRRLERAGVDVVELAVLPRSTYRGLEVEVPYGNLYACNGAVIVPVCGHAYDDEALAIIGEAYPGREVVPVDGTVIAYGGGGPHCITQQVPT